MKHTLLAGSLITGVLLGATVLRDVLPISHAETTFTSPVTTIKESSALLQNEQNTIDITEANQNSVVFVTTLTKPDVGFNQDDPFLSFRGMVPEADVEPERGSGSGFFVTDQDILTNYHVVDGADEITVKLHSDQKEYKAKVIGTAPDYDIALIRIEDPPKNIKAMRLGNSDTLKAGRKVVAMGAPFGLDFTITEGVVSAVGREIATGTRGIPQKAIQTDAAINPGNSGGPLVNSSGEVIGINTQIYTPTGRLGSAQSSGVGFAIPINVAKNLLPKLEKGEEVRSPTLGIQTGDVANLPQQIRKRNNLPETGVYVRSVSSGSPAAKAKLNSGDVIVEIDGTKISETNDLRKYLFSRSFGDTLSMKIVRDGAEKEIPVTLNDYQQK